ncbi:MAG: hypothetical protein M5U22_06340 [Thermoleophilia bacterium]|nr:hypothetical protein [Thermoleophilia bacterium]
MKSKKYVLLLLPIVIVAITALLSAGASATPKYAADTGKACGYCHVDPGGGGPLTAEGTAFKNNGHQLPTTTTTPPTTAPPTTAPPTTAPPTTTPPTTAPPTTTPPTSPPTTVQPPTSTGTTLADDDDDEDDDEAAGKEEMHGKKYEAHGKNQEKHGKKYEVHGKNPEKTSWGKSTTTTIVNAVGSIADDMKDFFSAKHDDDEDDD